MGNYATSNFLQVWGVIKKKKLIFNEMTIIMRQVKKKKSQVWKSEEDLRPESPAYGYVSLKKLLKFRSPGQDGH